MNVLVVVQARLGSARLPGKVLADIRGKPILQHVVERAQAISGTLGVVLTCPTEDRMELEAAVGDLVVGFAGHEPPDVLSGFMGAIRLFGAGVDTVIRLTGDCPLLAPEVCAAVSRLVTVGRARYATNDTRISGFPDGLDCQAFSWDMLHAAYVGATDPADREHVCPWMERYGPYPALMAGAEGSSVKLSVDTAEDLARVRAVMGRLREGDYSWRGTREAVLGLGDR